MGLIKLPGRGFGKGTSVGDNYNDTFFPYMYGSIANTIWDGYDMSILLEDWWFTTYTRSPISSSITDLSLISSIDLGVGSNIPWDGDRLASWGACKIANKIGPYDIEWYTPIGYWRNWYGYDIETWVTWLNSVGYWGPYGEWKWMNDSEFQSEVTAEYVQWNSDVWIGYRDYILPRYKLRPEFIVSVSSSLGIQSLYSLGIRIKKPNVWYDVSVDISQWEAETGIDPESDDSVHRVDLFLYYPYLWEY